MLSAFALTILNAQDKPAKEQDKAKKAEAPADPALAAELKTTEKSATQLAEESGALIKKGDFVAARPIIKELLLRLKGTEDAPGIKQRIEDYNYYIACSYVQEYQMNRENTSALGNSETFLTNFVNDYPNSKNAVNAIQSLATVYALKNDLIKSAETFEKLLHPPYAATLGLARQNQIVKQIATTFYFRPDSWNDGEKWFKLLFDRSPLGENKVFAAVALARMSMAKKDYVETMKYFPYMVYECTPRYDIALNIDFLKAGDQLAKDKKFNLATLFYSMVYSKDRIVAGLEKSLGVQDKKFKRMLALSPDSPQTKESEAQVKYLRSSVDTIKSDVQDYTPALIARAAANYSSTKRGYEGFWSYIKLMEAYPTDENFEAYVYAAFSSAYTIKKRDEMFRLGKIYEEKYPNGEHIHDVKLQIADYYRTTDQKELFLAACFDFIEKYHDISLSSKFVFMLGSTWLNQHDYASINKYFNEYIKKYPQSPVTEGSYYWTGMAALMQGDYKTAVERLKYIYENYTSGEYEEDALYRYGIAAFGVGDYSKARECFTTFMDRYASSNMLGEIEFFLGDIEGAMGEVDEAIKHYMNVENLKANQSFVNSAYIQSVKLLIAAARHEDAIKIIDSFMTKFPAENMGGLLYEKGLCFEALGRAADALNMYIKAVEDYGSKYNDDGIDKIIFAYDDMYKRNITKIAKTVAFLEKAISDAEFRKMLITKPALRYKYFEANPDVEYKFYDRFKKDPAYSDTMLKDTSILKQKLAEYKSQQDTYPKKDSVGIFTDIMNNAMAKSNNTLFFRCCMILEKLGKPVPSTKVFSEDDFKQASIKTLVWMGNENKKYGPEFAKKAYEEALDRDEPEFMIDAIYAMADFQASIANWKEALTYYARVENDYPANIRAGNAAIAQAQMYIKLKKNKDALAKFEEIMRTPAWKGDIQAETLYLLANMAQAEGNVDKAVMYYTQCYLGFSVNYNWSGKALLASARLLVANQRRDEAIKILDSFIDDKRNTQAKEYEEIKSYRQTL